MIRTTDLRQKLHDLVSGGQSRLLKLAQDMQQQL